MDTTILVTGGTGSFGHAFLKCVLTQGVQEVRVLSRDGFKQEVMRKELHEPRVKADLGNTQDLASINPTMCRMSIGFPVLPGYGDAPFQVSGGQRHSSGSRSAQ